RRSRRRLRRFLRRIAPPPPAAAAAFSITSAANGAVAGAGLRWRRGRVRRRVAAAGRRCVRRRRRAAQAAGTGSARPGHRPPQHRGAAPEREDRGEDEGASGAGAQRQQDGQGVDAGRDRRLRQVPSAPSQGAEHEPARWCRCRRAAGGRHVLG
ncbi:hypothetical protein ACJX0J_013629, partial [Zea mays]